MKHQHANKSEHSASSRHFFRVVEQLKYKGDDGKLDLRIKKLLGKASTSNLIFRIKQEIIRLNADCNRVIDFRSAIDDFDLDEVVLNNNSHYMDQLSYSTLLDEIEQYNGRFTIGVFEAVNKYFEANKHLLATHQEALNTELHLLHYGNYYFRQEERMNLAVSVVGFKLNCNPLDDDFQLSTEFEGSELKGVTSNISASAVKIRTRQELHEGDFVAIRYEGLQKDLIFDQKFVVYRVLKNTMETLGKAKVPVRHTVLLLQDIPINNEFSAFIRKFIYSYKHKYKVDLDSVYMAAQNKGFEQFYIERRRSLTLFYAADFTPVFQLTNSVCKNTIEFFTPVRRNLLPDLIAKDKLIQHIQPGQAAYYFVTKVNGSDNQFHFYSDILNGTADSTNLLRHFCRRHPGILFRVTVDKVKTAVALQKSAVPRSEQTHFRSHCYHRYAKTTEKLIHDLTFVVTLTPMMEGKLADCVAIDAQHTPTAKQHLTDKNRTLANLRSIESEYGDMRCEDRFSVDSTASFTYQGEKIRCQIDDVSTLGLLLICPSKVDIPKGRELSVTFDAYAQRTTKLNLKHCTYEVIASSGNALHLSNKKYPRHDGRLFWQQLTLSNLDKMVVKGRENEPYGLARALRNLASYNSHDAQAFYQINKKNIRLNMLALPRHDGTGIEMKQSLEELRDNYKAMFYEKSFLINIEIMLETMQRTGNAQQALAVLTYDANSSIEKVTSATLLLADGLEPQLLRNLLLRSGEKQKIRAFSVVLDKTNQEYKRYYIDEMQYIQAFAPHKYDTLRSLIEKVRGIITFTECTDVWFNLNPELKRP